MDELALAIASLDRGDEGPGLAFALHIAGLNLQNRKSYVESLAQTNSIVYADGMSVVLVARLKHGAVIQRVPTTDLGWSVLMALHHRLQRPPVVGLIGGPQGLADSAAAEIARQQPIQVSFTLTGHPETWAIEDWRSLAEPIDILIVGMGTPLETEWVVSNRERIGATTVMTCGGWFGHIIGHETRAPKFLQKVGLEWTWRLAQDPRRLGRRYAHGVISMITFLLKSSSRSNQRDEQ
jgi:exopolysaccharide biosynthesis WecB/TagA/CpsF family protein